MDLPLKRLLSIQRAIERRRRLEDRKQQHYIEASVIRIAHTVANTAPYLKPSSRRKLLDEIADFRLIATEEKTSAPQPEAKTPILNKKSTEEEIEEQMKAWEAKHKANAKALPAVAAGLGLLGRER